MRLVEAHENVSGVVVFCFCFNYLKKKKFFFFFWLAWVLVAPCRLSLVVLSWGSIYDPHKVRQTPNHWITREVPMTSHF